LKSSLLTLPWISTSAMGVVGPAADDDGLAELDRADLVVGIEALDGVDGRKSRGAFGPFDGEDRGGIGIGQLDRGDARCRPCRRGTTVTVIVPVPVMPTFVAATVTKTAGNGRCAGERAAEEQRASTGLRQRARTGDGAIDG